MGMEHEQVNDRAVALYIKGGKLTGRLLAKAMSAMLKRAKKARDAPRVGRQDMKKLIRTRGDTDSIEIKGRVKSFEQIARKYQVGYHIERERGVSPPIYTVYFSGKQNGNVTAAFKEYTELMLKTKEKKPSLLARLDKFKEIAKSMAAPVKHRDRGGREL